MHGIRIGNRQAAGARPVEVHFIDGPYAGYRLTGFTIAHAEPNPEASQETLVTAPPELTTDSGGIWLETIEEQHAYAALATGEHASRLRATTDTLRNEIAAKCRRREATAGSQQPLKSTPGGHSGEPIQNTSIEIAFGKPQADGAEPGEIHFTSGPYAGYKLTGFTAKPGPPDPKSSYTPRPVVRPPAQLSEPSGTIELDTVKPDYDGTGTAAMDASDAATLRRMAQEIAETVCDAYRDYERGIPLPIRTKLGRLAATAPKTQAA